MMNLVIAESARLWARRMTRFFPVGLGLVFVAGVVIAYLVINSEDSSPDFVDSIAGGIEATNILSFITPVLPLMAFTIGASYIGADAKTGVLEQLLTWEPRRIRLLIARVVSCFAGVAVLTMVLSAFFVALLYGLAAVTGTTDGTTGELWSNVAVITLRTGLAAGLFGVFGLGVTLLINSSMASIVGFVIYWFVIELFIISAFLPRVSPYLPVTNFDAFSRGVDVERAEGNVFSGEFELVFSHGWPVAGLFLLAWVTVALSASAVAFVRRDIQ